MGGFKEDCRVDCLLRLCTVNECDAIQPEALLRMSADQLPNTQLAWFNTESGKIQDSSEVARLW